MKLGELVDVLKHAACVVTNDTGPGHLALGVGAPTVLLAGGGHFGSFVPYPEEIRPAKAEFLNCEMDCYHCLWVCPKRASRADSFPCVADITVDQVWDAVQRWWGSAGLLPRRARHQLQRVHRSGQFFRQQGVDHAVALDAGLAGESLRHVLYAEMGLAAGAVAGMADVAAGIVEHFQPGGGQSLGKFPLDGGADLHCRSFLLNHAPGAHRKW